MSIIKRNGNFLNPFPAIFDDFLSRDLFDWNASNYSNSGTTLPAVNIKETADNFEVEMAAPGMNKEDFNVTLDGNVLTISAERKAEKSNNQQEKYSRKEFYYESFQRKFSLPKEVVDEQDIQAKYENGLLRLIIPKKEEARPKPPRSIQIS
jgi:HSP20 family protein